jgi:hypothetical protein
MVLTSFIILPRSELLVSFKHGIASSDPEKILESLKEKEFYTPLYTVLTERSPLDHHDGMQFTRFHFTFVHNFLNSFCLSVFLSYL